MPSGGASESDFVPIGALSLCFGMDFQNRPFRAHLAQPAGGAENFRFFDEKIQKFGSKLRESTGNRSQMFSKGVGDVCDALARVSAPSGVEIPSKFMKNQESES